MGRKSREEKKSNAKWYANSSIMSRSSFERSTLLRMPATTITEMRLLFDDTTFKSLQITRNIIDFVG